MRRYCLDLLLLTIGAAISALGTQGLIVASGLGSGGIAGLAILLYYLGEVPIGLTTLLLNVPLLIIGYKEIGGKFIFRTAFGVVAISFFLSIFSKYNLVPEKDILMGALFGGVLQGFGTALVMRSEGSLGGTDIVAKVLNRRYGFTIGIVGLAANLIVVIMSWSVLGSFKVMYTLISLYVSSKVIDTILDGLPMKSAFIVTSCGEGICQQIINKVNRGVTLLNAKGGYTQANVNVLICVVSLPELVRLKRLVKHLDPDAFVIVGDAKEVLGKGFRKLD